MVVHLLLLKFSMVQLVVSLEGDHNIKAKNLSVRLVPVTRNASALFLDAFPDALVQAEVVVVLVDQFPAFVRWKSAQTPLWRINHLHETVLPFFVREVK